MASVVLRLYRPRSLCTASNSATTLGRVPLAGGRLLAGLRLAPDEDHTVVEPDRLPVDLALQVLRHLDGLVLIALPRGPLRLAFGVVVDRLQLAPQPQVSLLQLLEQDAAAEELALAGGDRQ
jgi:hypothetical protein